MAEAAESSQQPAAPTAKTVRECFRLVERGGLPAIVCRRCGGRGFVEREVDYDGTQRVERFEYSCVRCAQRAYAERPCPRQPRQRETGK